MRQSSGGTVDPFHERLQRALSPDFEIERELGSGGQARVFLAREVSLDREVAIKTIRPELATAIAVERFLREARALAALGHPNIVPIHRFGTTADGIPYIVMQYLGGDTLERRLEDGPLPPPDVVRIGRDVLSALEAAHGLGIIHRDIKPGNLFLEPGRAVVADFGIAKVLRSRDEPLTKREQSPGTPQYASPEQLAGAEVSHASDFWSLGAVLYEAVTGRVWTEASPFDDPRAANWAGVPPVMRSALERALALAPADRWPDGASFARALEKPRSPAGRWVAAVAASALLIYLLWPEPPAPLLASPDLTIVPFGSTATSDRRLGVDLSRTVRQIIHDFDRISVAPLGDTVGSSAKHVVRGSVAVQGDTVVIHVRVAGGSPERVLGQSRRTGLVNDRWRVAEQVALDIIRIVRPETGVLGVECAPTSVDSYEAWLDGEDAFAHDDWEGAEGYFERAMALDSAFCLPGFRLALARRWSRQPWDVALERALLQHRDRLPLADRLLLDAELEQDPGLRRRLFARAVEADPFSGYAPLEYGSDLFHRGALDGIALDSSVALVREAIARDASLSPAHDQLVWAQLRLGRRAAAESALAGLLRHTPDPAARFVPADVFRLLYLARFEPDSVGAMVGGGGQAASSHVLEWARFGLSFDLSGMQALIGGQLTTSSDARVRARGHITRGLARLARGQPLGGMADFDTAAALVPSFELQAAQWRVLGAHIGIPGVPDSAVQSGVRRLGEWARGSAPGRSVWTLGVDAAARGGTADARGHLARLPPADSSLRVLLRGLLASRNSPGDALLETASLRGAAEERNRLGDPFARSLLHLLRAGWFDAVGDSLAAARERRWHENSDFEGWLEGEIQSAEVDWVAGVYVRVREGMRHIDAGDLSACGDLRRVVDTLWVDAEPGVDSLRRAGQAKALACP